MRSYSVEQLSSIKLYFKRGTDLYRSRQLVQERLAGVTSQLPTWASPPFMMPPLSSTARVMKIGMTSSDLSMEEMSAIAYWKIRQRLSASPAWPTCSSTVSGSSSGTSRSIPSSSRSTASR